MCKTREIRIVVNAGVRNLIVIKEMIAKYEVDLASKNVNAYADLTLPEETLELEDRTVYTRSVPVGIVACICPWNCGTNESSYIGGFRD